MFDSQNPRLKVGPFSSGVGDSGEPITYELVSDRVPNVPEIRSRFTQMNDNDKP